MGQKYLLFNLRRNNAYIDDHFLVDIGYRFLESRRTMLGGGFHKTFNFSYKLVSMEFEELLHINL